MLVVGEETVCWSADYKRYWTFFLWPHFEDRITVVIFTANCDRNTV